MSRVNSCDGSTCFSLPFMSVVWAEFVDESGIWIDSKSYINFVSRSGVVSESNDCYDCFLAPKPYPLVIVCANMLRSLLISAT